MESKTVNEYHGSLSYSETRTVNIGNYESIKCELRYTNNVKPINKKEFTVDVSHNEIIRLTDGDLFNESAKLVTSRVRKVLNAREADIRMRTAKFVDSFLPEEKTLLQKLIGLRAWREKNKRFKVEESDIKDFFHQEDNSFEDEVEI